MDESPLSIKAWLKQVARQIKYLIEDAKKTICKKESGDE